MEMLKTEEISNNTKEACAIETMHIMLHEYAEDKSISFEEALCAFARSSTYQVLFDFETAVWKEGPVYLRSLFNQATG